MNDFLSCNCIKVILWDFDGVLMNSNDVRELGFKKVLQEFSDKQVEKLLFYHRKNGGLSRYVKFRYFIEECLDEVPTDENISILANSFSIIMKNLLTNKELLIDETINYVKDNFTKIDMHIVSGSDQIELRYLCNELDISKYFVSINGSPTSKNELVNKLVTSYNLEKEKFLLIGDSINDYEAAKVNNINFLAYNNSYLDKYSDIKLKFNSHEV